MLTFSQLALLIIGGIILGMTIFVGVIDYLNKRIKKGATKETWWCAYCNKKIKVPIMLTAQPYYKVACPKCGLTMVKEKKK